MVLRGQKGLYSCPNRMRYIGNSTRKTGGGWVRTEYYLYPSDKHAGSVTAPRYGDTKRACRSTSEVVYGTTECSRTVQPGCIGLLSSTVARVEVVELHERNRPRTGI